MRRIVYLALGFATACGLSLYSDRWEIRLIGTGLVLLLSILAERKPGAVRRFLVSLLGCALGFAWFGGYTAHYVHPISDLDGKTIECSIRVSDYGRETDYGSAVDGTIQVEGNTYRVTVYLKQVREVKPGDMMTGLFRLRVTAQAGEDPSSYYQGKGVFLLAYQKDELRLSSEECALRDVPAIIRYRIQGILETYIPSDCVAFAKALLLGDTSQLSYSVDTDLKVSGIRHVVAVSGLHISIFFAIISTITFRKRFLTALVGTPLLLLFAAVAGFTPSVTRACIMCGLMLVAQLLNKEYDGPSALSFAVLIMLAVNPYCIGSVSFQLSVASVAGIFLFAPGIREKLTAGLKNKKREAIWSIQKACRWSIRYNWSSDFDDSAVRVLFWRCQSGGRVYQPAGAVDGQPDVLSAGSGLRTGVGLFTTGCHSRLCSGCSHSICTDGREDYGGVSLGGSLYRQSLRHDLAVLCILSASDLSGMQKDGGGLHLLHDIVAVPCADGILAGTVFVRCPFYGIGCGTRPVPDYAVRGKGLCCGLRRRQ